MRNRWRNGRRAFGARRRPLKIKNLRVRPKPGVLFLLPYRRGRRGVTAFRSRQVNSRESKTWNGMGRRSALRKPRKGVPRARSAIRPGLRLNRPKRPGLSLQGNEPGATSKKMANGKLALLG